MNAVADDIDRAAEAIRAANHSTARGPLDGPESYTAVGNLAELVHRLPQVLDFLTRSLRRAEPAQHCDDRGHDPAVALDLARFDLDDVRTAVETAGHHLASAHNHLAHLGRRLSED